MDSVGPKQLRALFVEDSVDDYDLLVVELERGGYQLIHRRVDTAAAMNAALDETPWDIVFSDYSMPSFSALGALGVLRDRNSLLPCIIVSGTIGEETAVEVLRGGARDFLLKDRLARLVPAVERELHEATVLRDRNKMQEQLTISDRMASVGTLAAGVAHEINNPLAAVMSNLDLAMLELTELSQRNEPVNPKALAELVAEISDARDATRRIREIVRDVKLFSRSGDEVRSAVDVRRALESALRMAWNEIRHRAQLTRELGPVPDVEANESRLGQVFLNLIINAAQSIPEGSAHKNEISVTSALGVDGRVVVEIRDTGSGMTADIQKRLFTPFFTTKPIGVGTGLGLSICHRIVSGLGGEITVDSKVGVGTTFRVHLPVAAVGTRIASEIVAPFEMGRRGRILVVDDEQVLARALGRVLRDHQLVVLDSADEALRLIEGGERYDVILCDLMMPVMTGMELHDALSRFAPDQANAMVFMTGGAVGLIHSRGHTTRGGYSGEDGNERARRSTRASAVHG